jgi:hypothetical protein
MVDCVVQNAFVVTQKLVPVVKAVEVVTEVLEETVNPVRQEEMNLW